MVDCNWKIRSCSRIGRCPSTNVKIGRGRGEFDERNFPGDPLLSSDLRPPSHCYRSGGQMPVLLIQASSSGPEQDRMNLYLGRHDWELARNPISRIPPGRLSAPPWVSVESFGRHYCDLEALARSDSVRLTTKEGSGMLRLIGFRASSQSCLPR